MQYVPVVDFEQRPLMPTTPARAERWIKSGKATPFFRKNIFCVRLNVEPSNRHIQPLAVGIDPGSKREGYTVKSKAHTYLISSFMLLIGSKTLNRQVQMPDVQDVIEKHLVANLVKTVRVAGSLRALRRDGNSKSE